MIRKPVCWADALKKLFSPLRKKRWQTRLGLEELNERIVPAVYHPSATIGDPTVTPLNLKALNTLRSDIILANEDLTLSAVETFDLAAGATYKLSIPNPKTGSENLGFFGDLDLNNLHGKGTKTYIFIGLGTGATIDQTVLDRVMDVAGPNVIAEFRNITITGGAAVDNGSIGAVPGYTTSEGGGILNQGGEVILNDSHIENNVALGFNGFSGGNGFTANKKGEIAGFGFPGSSGSFAFGGGMYSTGGPVIITNSTITNNVAVGGNGGNGGAGGSVTGSATGNAGGGGTGGTGGDAGGGGIYLGNGTLSLSSDTFVSTNEVDAGHGGAGGAGGLVKVKGGTKSGIFFSAGAGAAGAAGGKALGGGIGATAGTVTVSLNSEVTNNRVFGGNGGAGGAGGAGTKTNNIGGPGGAGKGGGSAFGGGIIVQTGNITVQSNSLVENNQVAAGIGGNGGAGGSGYASAGLGASGGSGGATAAAGGIYAGNGNVIVMQAKVNGNRVFAAVGGKGGNGGNGIGKAAVIQNGGNGGNAGIAQAGGIFSGAGSVTIEKSSSVLSNLASGHGPHTGTSAGGAGSHSFPSGAAGGVGGNAHFKGSLIAGIGGNAGSGFSAFGGGIYAADGSVSILTKSLVSNNEAKGFKGGVGGVGGSGTLTGNAPNSAGAGGAGGTAIGGGVYAINGAVTISASSVNFNEVFAGNGGAGGMGGDAKNKDFAQGGNGGAAGNAGPAAGGGVWVETGSVTVEKNGHVNSNGFVGTTGGITGVLGGKGGTGGAGGTDHHILGATGIGGAAGNGGTSGGGGIWIQTGNVSVQSGSTVVLNVVVGGIGGTGGAGFAGGAAGIGGDAQGGGIYALNGSVAVSGAVTKNLLKGGTGGEGGFAQVISGGLGAAAGLAQGGGIYAGKGNVFISHHAKIDGNTASGGAGGKGGDCFDFGGTGGVGGLAGVAEGGGIYAGSGAVGVTSALVSKNFAAGNSGGVAGEGGHGGLGGNAAIAAGGGIYIGNGSLTLAKASINANRAGGLLGGGAGGGIFSSGTGGLGGNGGNAEGGGLYISSGAVSFSMTQSSVTNNTAGPGGDGGTGGGSVTTNAGPSGNAFGGGIYAAGGTTTISDSTIGLNTANPGGVLATSMTSAPGISQGGGIYFTNTTATIGNSTVARNSSNDEGGGILNAGTLTLTSTLVADNISVTTADADLVDTGATPTTITDSLIQNPNGNSVASTTGNYFGEADSLINLSKTLQTAPNGTNYFTITSNTSDALKNGSNPNNLQFDQIGHLRTLGGKVDIGAIQTGASITSVPFIVASSKGGFVEIIDVANSTETVIQNFQPFTGYTGLVSVAVGDINNDGIPDIIVAAQGKVKVYDGASALVPGVNFNATQTWSRLSAIGRTTPVLEQLTPLPSYAGSLNIAAGDLLGNGVEDIIVGTGAGTEGEVVIYNSATLAKVATLVPFGVFTGGVAVAAGDVTGSGPEELIVGTQTKSDQVKVYTLSGATLTQLGKTIIYNGAFSTTAQLQIAAIDVVGNGIDDIAIGVLNNGIGSIEVVNGSGTPQKSFNIGSGLTSMGISVYNPLGQGADSLLVGTIPVGGFQFHVINPLTGTQTSGFNEFPALSGAIAVAAS